MGQNCCSRFNGAVTRPSPMWVANAKSIVHLNVSACIGFGPIYTGGRREINMDDQDKQDGKREE